MNGRRGRAFSIRSRLALCKPRLSLLAAAAAMTGYLLGPVRGPAGVLAVGLAVLVLASGAASLNQVQDRDADGLMDRTNGRPIPSGAVRPEIALGSAAVLIAAGLALLLGGGLRPALLGGLAVVWYNGLYARLKKSSPWAAVPGAITGALVPAIGWTFAGGRADDTRIAALGLVLFIWQVPHFWLVALERAPEYRRAGLPHILDVLSERQARRLTAVWILATAAATLAVAGWSALSFPATRWAALALSLWLAVRALRFGLPRTGGGPALFRAMNVHMASLLCLISVDRLFG